MCASLGHLLQATGGVRVLVCLERCQLPPLPLPCESLSSAVRLQKVISTQPAAF